MTTSLFRSVAILCFIICAAGGCSRSDNTEPARGNPTAKQSEPATTAIGEPSSSAHAPKDDPGKEDLKGLEGEWVMVSGEQRGEKTPPDIVNSAILKIKDDDLAHTIVGVITLKGPFTIDPAKTPKSIDVTDFDGPSNGKKLLGIYELSSDELKLCFSLPEKDRPSDFSTTTGTGHILHVWKRKK